MCPSTSSAFGVGGTFARRRVAGRTQCHPNLELEAERCQFAGPGAEYRVRSGALSSKRVCRPTVHLDDTVSDLRVGERLANCRLLGYRRTFPLWGHRLLGCLWISVNFPCLGSVMSQRGTYTTQPTGTFHHFNYGRILVTADPLARLMLPLPSRCRQLGSERRKLFFLTGGLTGTRFGWFSRCLMGSW